MNNFQNFTKGLIKENPVFVMLLGMCPSMAVTTGAYNGMALGLATCFVLTFSSIAISLLRNTIPNQVRLPCYIVIIAGLVTFLSIVLRKLQPELYNSLGLFLSLIVVNCVVLARMESFASKNKLLPSIIDAVGMGLGFTLALILVGSIREIFGSGSWFGLELPTGGLEPMLIFILPSGGFFTLGVIIAIVNKLANREVPDINCEGCPSRAICKHEGKETEE